MGNVDTMISTLESNGVLMLDTAQIGDLQDIDKRVKFGDESGWRGDPTMAVFINRFTGEFEVWGVDRAGQQYKACSHHKLNTEIITKLREGDPQRNDVFQRVLDHNARVQAEKKRKDFEKFSEVAEKLQWGIRQDFAQHLGGRGRKVSFPGTKEG